MLMCSSKTVKQKSLKHVKHSEAEPQVWSFMGS